MDYIEYWLLFWQCWPPPSSSCWNSPTFTTSAPQPCPLLKILTLCNIYSFRAGESRIFDKSVWDNWMMGGRGQLSLNSNLEWLYRGHSSTLWSSKRYTLDGQAFIQFFLWFIYKYRSQIAKQSMSDYFRRALPIKRWPGQQVQRKIFSIKVPTVDIHIFYTAGAHSPIQCPERVRSVSLVS